MLPFYKSAAFWKGFTAALAGLLALLAYFGVIPTAYAYPSDALLAIIYAVLQFVGVVPELRARGLLGKG